MDSVIFDLDGTLWDSTQVVLASWNKAIETYTDLGKVISKEELESYMGLQIPEIGKKLFPNVKEEKRALIFEKCTQLELAYLSQQGGNLYKGLEAVLQALSPKYKLFIVSNCQEGYIETFLEFYQLQPYFTDFENPGRTGLSKGENIRLIMERNQLKAPIYVGDTQGDLQATRVAGIPFVYASYGFGNVDEFDYIIHQLPELLDIL